MAKNVRQICIFIGLTPSLIVRRDRETSAPEWISIKFDELNDKQEGGEEKGKQISYKLSFAQLHRFFKNFSKALVLVQNSLRCINWNNETKIRSIALFSQKQDV